VAAMLQQQLYHVEKHVLCAVCTRWVTFDGQILRLLQAICCVCCQQLASSLQLHISRAQTSVALVDKTARCAAHSLTTLLLLLLPLLLHFALHGILHTCSHTAAARQHAASRPHGHSLGPCSPTLHPAKALDPNPSRRHHQHPARFQPSGFSHGHLGVQPARA
jgi:hypothetical protein